MPSFTVPAYDGSKFGLLFSLLVIRYLELFIVHRQSFIGVHHQDRAFHSKVKRDSRVGDECSWSHRL